MKPNFMFVLIQYSDTGDEDSNLFFFCHFLLDEW